MGEKKCRGNINDFVIFIIKRFFFWTLGQPLVLFFSIKDVTNLEWIDIINEEKKKPYYEKLKKLVDEEYKNYLCHPDYNNIFNSFKYTKFNDV